MLGNWIKLLVSENAHSIADASSICLYARIMRPQFHRFQGDRQN